MRVFRGVLRRSRSFLGFLLVFSALSLATPAVAQPTIKQLYPVDGPDDAKVTIVMFGGYECPYSGRAAPTIAALRRDYAQDIRVMWINHPLYFHHRAIPAARAALAAKNQGAFWRMHSKLMGNQTQLNRASFMRWARELGLDIGRFIADMGSAELTDIIARDEAISRAFGVTGTPAFLINGTKVVGAQPLATFRRIVEDELAAWDRGIAAGMEPTAMAAHRVAATNPKIAALYSAWLIRGDDPPRVQPGKPPTAAPEPSTTQPRAPGKTLSDTVVALETKGRPSLGNLKASKARVVVFAGLSCPFSIRLLPTLLELAKARPKERIAWLHYPLSSRCRPDMTVDMHPAACAAATWMEAAAKQGKLKRFLREVAHRGRIHSPRSSSARNAKKAAKRLRADLLAIATAAQLNVRKAQRFVQRADRTKLMAADIAQAKLAGVRGTPTLFVDGRLYTGPRTLEGLTQALDRDRVTKKTRTKSRPQSAQAATKKATKKATKRANKEAGKPRKKATKTGLSGSRKGRKTRKISGK